VVQGELKDWGRVWLALSHLALPTFRKEIDKVSTFCQKESEKMLTKVKERNQWYCSSFGLY